MAHSYPPGEQARWNELERRILLSDVDIKRLWKAMSQNDITSPAFDGAPAEPESVYKILIAGWTSVSTLALMYNTAFSGSGNLVKAINPAVAQDAETQDLSHYDLIFFTMSAGTITIPSWLGSVAMSSWLLADKQRRLVLIGDRFTVGIPGGTWLTEFHGLLSGIGSALSFVGHSFAGSTTGLTTTGAHYLASGATLETAESCYVTGGTQLFRWTNPSQTPSGDVAQIESTASGSEVILLGDLGIVTTKLIVNTPFLQRLYPSASYGGTLIP